jgi:hypothetical protein
MADRDYRILVAKDQAGLVALAGTQWTILQSTVKEFRTLDTDDDLQLGKIGRVAVDREGFVALAYKS